MVVLTTTKSCFVALTSVFVYLPVQVHLFCLPVVYLPICDHYCGTYLSVMLRFGQVVILKSTHSLLLDYTHNIHST